MGLRWMRYVARGLALLWAVLWCIFGFFTGLTQGGLFIHTAMPGLIFLMSALVPWRWEFLGGTLLLLEGLAVLVAYPMATRSFSTATVMFVLVTMAFPPMLSGLLFLMSSRKIRTTDSPAS